MGVVGPQADATPVAISKITVASPAIGCQCLGLIIDAEATPGVDIHSMGFDFSAPGQRAVPMVDLAAGRG